MRQDGLIYRGEALAVRNYAPIDELDDVGPPPPLPLIRYCGARGCRRRARPGGRHCAACHVAAVRRWRKRHRGKLTIRRRDASAVRDDGARARDSARAKLAMALRRGKLTRGACVVCGGRDVVALIAEAARPLDVTWVCRDDRQTLRERERDAEAQRVSAAAQAAWHDERARVLAAIDLLPPAERTRLRVTAVQGPAGVRLSPEAPLYTINLVRAYKEGTFRKPLQTQDS